MHRFEWWFVRLVVVGLLTQATPSKATGPVSEYLTVRNGLPQGFISAMLQDQRGFIWLATRDGLCRYDGTRFQVYNHDPQQPGSLAFSSLTGLREDKAGRIWIRTENNHIDCFDPVTEKTNHPSNSPAFRQVLGRHQLTGIWPDPSGNVWVTTQTNGFFRLNANGSVSHHHWAASHETQPLIRSLLLDKGGNLWLGTNLGLFRYNPQSKQFAAFRIAQGLPQNDVFSLYERPGGTFVLGFPGKAVFFDPAVGRAMKTLSLPGSPNQIPLYASDTRGIDYINQHRYTDETGLQPLPADAKLSRFSALSMLVDRSNVLWIGLDGDGVIKYDLNKRPFTAWPYTSSFSTDWMTQQAGIPLSSIPPLIRQQRPDALRYQFDRQKNLWLSSAVTPLYRYNPSQKVFEAVPPTGIEARWLPGGSFRMTALATGPSGEIWGLLGPDNRAVVRYNPTLRTFTAFPLPLPANNPYTIMGMLVDGGRIYLATQSHGLLRADLSTQRLVRWYAQASDRQSIPNNALLCLAQDPGQYNYLWIGTFGSGLCRLDKLTGQIRRFGVGQSLPNNVIYAIRPDGQGHLWLSTNRGLCRFDSRTFEVRNYTTDDGLPSEEFNRYHDVALPDGRLIFGGIGGYTVFQPGQVSDDAYKPQVALTALRINNQPVRATTPGSPLAQDIDQTTDIDLNHDQNFLAFDFSALQFNKSGKNQYRYKLTGLDKDWIYSGNLTTATYTNLPPGTYTFVVNASNTSGIWSPHVRKVRIVINPPVWATWWAYTGYVLLLIGAIVLFLRVRINRIQLRSRIELREQESAQLKQLDEVKSRFFANITHELRTPLTLILTPLDQLLEEITDPQHHNRLSMVYRSANRLLRLINELLDLAKLEAGTLTVTNVPGDLAEFVERTVSVFDEEARRKRVSLRVKSTILQPHYWFDSDKLDKILSNLLANAFKFTNPGGSISVLLELAQPAQSLLESAGPSTVAYERVRLTVSDSGKGIDPDKLPYIFNRFYQASPSSDQSVTGSGIGLALTKELVEIMQGSVSVSSKPSVGTTFVVELPCLPARLAASPVPATNPGLTGQQAGRSTAIDAHTYQLLLVEDNDEIAGYLADILSEHWLVKRVGNGQAGVEAALADTPDVIISDVLMPELNGYELCRQVKANPATSHIPVILLTAKTAVESRAEGFSAGADDYIAKPFDVNELLGRIRNRLDQQQRLRQHHRKLLLREGHLPNSSADPEDDFMNRVYTVLESRLDDSTFGVESLASAIGISRMHLNRKLKVLTGFTPNELIRVVRLNRAAELLLTGASISEVADRVGFDTPAYFSKVFKEHHHLTPTDFVEKNRQEVV
ncbi:ATP-binding protein [Spirosoma sp. 209]|uniref:hybrid sensor histidine kinase/response regulator transcription factor n=1 Tax=Spirosoma sp. 209 TaxID=1955701 RepID=UPI00098D0681|nr:ATP-binding protein [Spirosoma sp. 209]